MPLSDSKENRDSDAETFVSRKNYHFPQSRRHIQFLSKDINAIKQLKPNLSQVHLFRVLHFRIKVMLAADWNVGFIATDLDLLTFIGWFAILSPQDHGGLFGAILADGLDFIDFICQKKEVF